MQIFIYISLIVLTLGSYMCLYRLARGPTAPDRIVAIDILGIILVGFCAILSLLRGEDYYMSIALAWALLSFLGSVALAKYLEGKEFDE